MRFTEFWLVLVCGFLLAAFFGVLQENDRLQLSEYNTNQQLGSVTIERDMAEQNYNVCRASLDYELEKPR